MGLAGHDLMPPWKGQGTYVHSSGKSDEEKEPVSSLLYTPVPITRRFSAGTHGACRLPPITIRSFIHSVLLRVGPGHFVGICTMPTIRQVDRWIQQVDRTKLPSVGWKSSGILFGVLFL